MWKQVKVSGTHQRFSIMSVICQGELAEGWQKHFDGEGTPYYVNVETGESQWDAPQRFSIMSIICQGNWPRGGKSILMVRGPHTM